MSDPTPAPAASGGGNKPSLVTIVIIVFLLVFSNIIGYATSQLNGLFQMAKFNFLIILAIMAAVFFWKARK
jgi:uncharacterized membrane protein